MSGQSLEMERQAILDRMQIRRERYRRMLTDGADLDDAVIVDPHPAGPYPAAHSLAHGPLPGASSTGVYHRTGHGSARSLTPRNPVMRALYEHPYLVALGVAAVVAIGPKRILRTVTTSGTALSTVMASNNQSNVDLAGRLLTMIGAYVQGRTK
jgi:hypothetical protein